MGEFFGVHVHVEFNHSVGGFALDAQSFGTLFGRINLHEHQIGANKSAGQDYQKGDGECCFDVRVHFDSVIDRVLRPRLSVFQRISRVEHVFRAEPTLRLRAESTAHA